VQPEKPPLIVVVPGSAWDNRPRLPENGFVTRLMEVEKMRSRRMPPAVVLVLAAVAVSAPRAPAADGAGAGATGSLTLIQTEYLSPLDGNVVQVLFGQLAPVRGVTVLVDDISIGDFDVVEGSVSVPFLDSGPHTFRAETTSPEEPSFAEGTFFVRDTQPFEDPTGLVCEGNGPSEEGTCKAVLRWTLPADPPEFFWVLQDTIVTDRDLPATETSAVFEGVTAGEHIFGLRGLETAEPGLAFYAGPIIETACNVACDGAACRPPSAISLCQSGYGTGGGAVRVEVLPGGDYPGGIDILVGGSIVKNTAVSPGGRTVAFVPSLASGPLTLSLRGACADGRDTAAVDAGITLLEESPLPAPVEGGALACEFQAGQGLTATWRNVFPASFIDVHLVSAETTRLVATVPGGTESILIPGAAPGDTVAIQAFADVGGVCRGSPLATCPQSGRRFLRGLCSGAGTFPSISDGVFTLNFLFLGGTEPPCLEACDTSGDSSLDISDAVLLLNFLFLGGPAPAGWDTSGGVPVPACEIGSEENCAAAHSACP